MNKIKVLILISGNDNGGAAKYVLNLCNIKQEGIEIILGCIGEGYLFFEAERLNYNVTLFSTKNALDKTIVNYVKDNSIHIVNFHGAKAFFMYTFLNKKLDVISVATVHSDYRYDFENNPLKKMFYTPLSKWGLKKFENYICVSEYIKNVLEDEGFLGKKYIARNAIDVSTYNPSPSNNIRSSYGISQEDFVFIIVARFHPVKNHTRLIEAFAKLKKENTHIKLLCVGEGENAEEIVKKIKELELEDSIILTGFKDNIYDYFEAANISILPSISEAGDPPLVILESALAGIPVICSDIGNLRNIITEDMGYLIQPNNVEDIYLKMKESMINSAYLEEKGLLFNKYVKDNYSIDKFNMCYKEIFMDMSENRCHNE